MIVLDKRKYERIVTELIDAKDIRNLVDRYSLDRIYYYHILKDISLGQRSPNYNILKKIAQRRRLKDDFVIEQAKTILSYFMTYYQSLPADSLDYYKILNVQRNATDEEIRRSWIELMKTHHPDMAGADGIFSVLTNEQLRRDLRRRGVARARQFSWETAVRRVREIYGEVADVPAGTGPSAASSSAAAPALAAAGAGADREPHP
jgi:hypothetical protein